MRILHLHPEASLIAALAAVLPRYLWSGRLQELEEGAMLRVHVERSDRTTLTVEGRLTGAWVAELEKCWCDEVRAEPSRHIAVVLAAVSFVDADGRELLRRMWRHGVMLTGRGCLMKAVVNEIEATESRESTESLTRCAERTR